ncbi:SHD1 domain-containing protein [Roseimicrobium sp. ORNL1]|uniref:SHD1 domain-containing protein n=1 Tax=Roseimicrobium sp. ORNL1 TaxID=2711231 RepID=UPI0013E1FB91|nr:SHD1 domain-containing protein [Roseimicrobium sp. ORNL1]QIF04791.1 hypothetical protein G5S37_25835 [Roseimicrobium sp. ORNL1]
MNKTLVPWAALSLSLALSPLAGARTFTDKNGRSMEAEIVAKQGDQVRIKRTDGQQFTVPATTFSPADQEYIRAWQAPGGAPTPASTPGTPAKPGAPTAPSGTADPRVKPGAVVALEFPSLPKDHNGNVATCNVRIPEDYDPTKPVPLLVWIGGGKGGNTPNGGFALVDKGHYAIAGLPYPSTVPTPNTALDNPKDFDVIIDYHKAMLADVVKLLPNLDPKIRLVAGFSNGAHTIGTNLTRGEGYFIDLFNAFIIIEGGGRDIDAKKKLREKFAYLAWGNDAAKKGSKDYMANYVCKAVKDARLQVTDHEMDGVGHDFPESEKALVKTWIEKTVLPGLAAGPKKP